MIAHKLNSKAEFAVENKIIESGLAGKFDAFAQSQEPYKMVWWLLSLTILGGLALPLTFLLVYSYNGAVVPCLVASMLSFFACIVSNMGGMSIKVNLGLFFFSILLHLAIIAFTVLA